MVGSMARLVSQFKQSWSQQLDEQAIRQACVDAGHGWRERKLGPVATVRLFLLQILYGNVACNFVPHLAGQKVTGSAYCEARGRLPLAALQALLSRCTARMAESVRDTGLWLGHRLFLTDGSSFSMPDTQELRDHFGQHPQAAAGCGFPTAHWLALVHYGSGLIQKVITSRLCASDLSHAPELHPELQAGDVLVGDRAFCSFGHLALLATRGLHAVFRAHGAQHIDFTPDRPHQQRGRGKTGLPTSRWIQALGPLDQIVEWVRPNTLPNWITPEVWNSLPQTLRLRELRYTVQQPGFRTRTVTLVTTLLDRQRYPAAKLAEAYRFRWNIETCFGQLKTTMKMDVLRCETVPGVLKELTMFLLVYNLVRMTILQAAKRQGVPPQRISFVDALRWLATARSEDQLPHLVVNPHRPNRVEPRQRKRRPKGDFPWLQQSRQLLREQALAA